MLLTFVHLISYLPRAVYCCSASTFAFKLLGIYLSWNICACAVLHHIKNALDYKTSSNFRNIKEKVQIRIEIIQYFLTFDLFGAKGFFLWLVSK